MPYGNMMSSSCIKQTAWFGQNRQRTARAPCVAWETLQANEAFPGTISFMFLGICQHRADSWQPPMRRPLKTAGTGSRWAGGGPCRRPWE